MHAAISNELPAECQNVFRSVVATGPKVLSEPVPFELNSAVLTPGAKEILDQLADVLGSSVNSSTKFSITGHTDKSGSETYNLQLSQDRAKAVVAYLTNKGVKADELTFTGVGDRELADQSNPYASVNRRVEITNLGKN